MTDYFENVRVITINNKRFNRGAAVTIPGIGIFIGYSHRNNIDILRHEFGHMLQIQQKGFLYFWFKIAPTSLRSAFLSSKKEGHDHMQTWTEWNANKLSYEYFDKPQDWNFKNFPIEPTN